MKEQINLIILTKLYFLNVQLHFIYSNIQNVQKGAIQDIKTELYKQLIKDTKSMLQFINTCNSIYIQQYQGIYISRIYFKSLHS